MAQFWIISLVGGIVSGGLALVVSGALLGWMLRRAAPSNIDIDQTYEDMASLKHDLLSNSGGRDGIPTGWQTVLIAGVLPAVVMTLVLRALLAFTISLNVAAPLIVLVWLALTFLPVGIVSINKARRIAILEIASILAKIARSEIDEHWAIRCSKKVIGGDLFGEEEEDRLDLRIVRTEDAPVTLTVRGEVTAAEAGIGRSVSKTALRQFRLSGWFVDEHSETQVTLEHEWSLSDSSTIRIAEDLADVLQKLGFSLRHVRLSQVAPEPVVRRFSEPEDAIPVRKQKL